MMTTVGAQKRGDVMVLTQLTIERGGAAKVEHPLGLTLESARPHHVVDANLSWPSCVSSTMASRLSTLSAGA